MNEKLTLSMDSDDLPQDLQELYGIFDGIDIPDKKEFKRLFHEKHRIKIEVIK